MGRKLASITLSVALAATCFSGCRGRCLTPPGPLDQQRANAIVHDPFPQEDIGPSDPSARPLGYERPLPEAVRNRLVPDAMPWLGR